MMSSSLSSPSSFPVWSRGGRKGFTVIEVLVACAVLALMVAVLAALVSSFTGMIGLSSKRLKTGNQSRTVFDRMAFDLNSSVHTGGTEILFRKNAQASGGTATPNDSLLFLTNARTESADSRLAYIGYEVGEDTNEATGTITKSLLRGSKPFLWNDDITQASLGSGASLQALGRGVFRMEICFLKTDGTIVADPPAEDEIAAVICSTATLDEDTFAKLDSGERDSLADKLPNATDRELPLSTWSVDKFNSLPPRARIPVQQNVRFNQRYFYLQ
ncbi:MAG: type II secretion system protein J [Chthoniobacterales bacterium]